MQRGIALPFDELDLPPTLYKFRDFNSPYHKKSILDAELYIPSAKEFNDPYDCNLPFRYRNEDLTEENIVKKAMSMADKQFPNWTTEQKQKYVYEMVSERLFENPDHLKQFDEDSYDKINREFGVFCLTPEIRNFLMWSYYSDSHRGFAIGFDPTILLKTKLFRMGGLIMYTEYFPEFPLFSDDVAPGIHFANVFFKKSEIWSHEEEYRLLHVFGTGKVQPIPIEAVTEIVYGVNVNEPDELKFTAQLLDRYPHIKGYRMELEKNQFGLKKVQRF